MPSHFWHASLDTELLPDRQASVAAAHNNVRASRFFLRFRALMSFRNVNLLTIETMTVV